MKNTTKKTSLLLSALVALSCVSIGGLYMGAVSAKAETEAFNPQTSLSMLKGANLRKDSSKPGLKFTAEIQEYSADYQYGMLVIPAAWLDTYTFDNNYVEVLNEQVGEGNYKNELHTPYQDEEEGTGAWRIASVIEVSESSNFTVEYIGIAYVTDGESYKYAFFNEEDNARSMTYVAQMSIKYSNLTDAEKVALEKYVSSEDLDTVTTVSDYLIYSAETNSYNLDQMALSGSVVLETGEDYALSLNLNGLNAEMGALSITTKDYYFGITEVSFKAKMDATWTDAKKEENPEGIGYGWWGFNYFEEYEEADVYTNQANTTIARSTVNNDWEEIKFTFAEPIGENGVYLSIVAAVSEFANPTLLIDDFKIVAEDGETFFEDFNNVSLTEEDDGLFVKMDESEINLVRKAEPSLSILGAPKNNEMTVLTSTEIIDPMKSKKSYSDITSITFDVKVASTFACGWGGMQLGYATGATDVYEYGKVYEHFSLNGVVFNGGYFDFLNKLTQETLYHADIQVDGASVYATFTPEVGDAVYASTTLTTTSDLYLAFYHESKASDGYTISDFTINSASGVEYGVSNIFNGGEGVSFTEEENPAWNFENVLASGVAAYLKDGNYASITGNPIENVEDLAASAVVLSAGIDYSINGDKEFAIVVGGTESAPDYFIVDKGSIAFYTKDGKAWNAAVNASNSLLISVTKTGKIFLRLNGGENTYVGTTGDLTALKLVGFGGSGSVAFGEIEGYAYTARGKYGSTVTEAYANYATDGTLEGLTVSEGSSAEYLPADGILSINLNDSVGANGDKYAFVTTNMHEFKSISFDMYVPNFSTKKSWIGNFAFGSVLDDNYSGAGVLDDMVRGAWNHVEITVENGVASFNVSNKTLEVPAGANYFYIRLNPGDSTASTAFADDDCIKLNNFTVTDVNGTYTDTYNEGSSVLLTAAYNDKPAFHFEVPDTKLNLNAQGTPEMLGIVASAVGAHEVIAVQLKDAYTNVTEITFKAKYDNTVGVTDRWGLGISETGEFSPYRTQTFEFPMDNEWHEYKFEFTAEKMNMYLDGDDRGSSDAYNAAGTYYFGFVICPKQTLDVDEVLVYFDEFSITANGETYADDFSTGVGDLFDKATGRRELQSISIEGNGNSFENIATELFNLDAYISGGELNVEGLGEDKKVLNGSISYTLSGEKEFVVILGEDRTADSADFLYVTATKITLCKLADGVVQAVKEIEATDSLQLKLLKSGELTVNGEVMGVLSNAPVFKMADVNGVGTLTITNLQLSTQKFIAYTENN